MVDDVLTLLRPLVVFDTETTGTFPSRDRIIEIACIKIHPDGRRETFHRKVNPGVPIPEESARIHGIRDPDVAGLPPFSSIAVELLDFLRGCDLAGYNVARFDIPILQFEFSRAGVDFELKDLAVVDSQQIFFSEEGRSLSDAMRFYVGEEHPAAHSALADAEATVRVLDGQLRRYPHLPRRVDTLAEHYSPAGTGKIDPEGKLLLKEDVPYVNFGNKHRGKTFDQVYKEEPGFFDWILKSDFSLPVKRYVGAYLARVRPARPADKPRGG